MITTLDTFLKMIPLPQYAVVGSFLVRGAPVSRAFCEPCYWFGHSRKQLHTANLDAVEHNTQFHGDTDWDA